MITRALVPGPILSFGHEAQEALASLSQWEFLEDKRFWIPILTNAATITASMIAAGWVMPPLGAAMTGTRLAIRVAKTLALGGVIGLDVGAMIGLAGGLSSDEVWNNARLGVNSGMLSGLLGAVNAVKALGALQVGLMSGVFGAIDGGRESVQKGQSFAQVALAAGLGFVSDAVSGAAGLFVGQNVNSLSLVSIAVKGVLDLVASAGIDFSTGLCRYAGRGALGLCTDGEESFSQYLAKTVFTNALPGALMPLLPKQQPKQQEDMEWGGMERVGCVGVAMAGIRVPAAVNRKGNPKSEGDYRYLDALLHRSRTFQEAARLSQQGQSPIEKTALAHIIRRAGRDPAHPLYKYNFITTKQRRGPSVTAVLQALERHGGVRVRAAQELDMDEGHVGDLLKELAGWQNCLAQPMPDRRVLPREWQRYLRRHDATLGEIADDLWLLERQWNDVARTWPVISSQVRQVAGRDPEAYVTLGRALLASDDVRKAYEREVGRLLNERIATSDKGASRQSSAFCFSYRDRLKQELIDLYQQQTALEALEARQQGQQEARKALSHSNKQKLLEQLIGQLRAVGLLPTMEMQLRYLFHVGRSLQAIELAELGILHTQSYNLAHPGAELYRLPRAYPI